MFVTVVILKYKEDTYILKYDGNFEDWRYSYLYGNWNCDCNRSLDIQSQCNSNFPELDCGTDIKLISIERESGFSLYKIRKPNHLNITINEDSLIYMGLFENEPKLKIKPNENGGIKAVWEK